MLEQLQSRISGLKERESRKIYEAAFSFRADQAPAYSEWTGIMQEIPVRDQMGVFLQTDDEESFKISRTSEAEAYAEFISDLAAEEEISAKLEIHKSVSDNRCSVYNFREFSDDIMNLPLNEALTVFSMFLNETNGHMVFELFDSTDIFHTKTMFFLPAGNAAVSTGFDRKQRLAQCRDTSYFYSQESYELLPDDFKIEVGYGGNPFQSLFSRLETILAACFLATNSAIQDNKAKLQIMGQRSVEYTYSLNDMHENPVLYKIYDWVYSGGNPMDKAIIARNIICLHCKYESFLDMSDKVRAAILSNYNLYLKENVTQYLELKGKAAEFINGTVSRTGEYAMELLDKFKSNILAIFGFMFTVVMADIVSGQSLDHIFTKDITLILELVLAGSVIYLIICYKQSKYQLRKVYESYDSLKGLYEGILTEDDIKECFQDDKVISEMKETVNKSEKISLAVWVGVLVVLAVIIEHVGDEPIIRGFMKALSGG